MKTRITISISEEVAERLHDNLEYGDNRSEWIEEAITQRLDRMELEEAEEGNLNRTPVTSN